MTRDLADFKTRLPVVDIVQRYVRLTRHGPLHKGLCPFHREKTPSFTVTAARGTYHCFGCGAHGNALDFLMALEGLDFAEAVKRAAELTGLEPPTRGERDPERDRKRSLSELLEEAGRRFRRRLESADGAAVRAYLDRRGLSPSTIARFELGSAGGGRAALTQALTAAGAALDDLVDAGLTIVPEDGGPAYDRFRERLMFPIRDGRGRLVGFGGRALDDRAAAKYLNGPEGPLFQKRELLYGANGLDRRAGRGRLHVVEGYMDVIALAQHGVAAVAPLGTAMTEAQLERLWRLDDAPLVCLDGDAAGVQAAGRLAERALAVLKPGRSLAFALLPPGEDPDSLVRTGGSKAFARATRVAVPLVEMLWKKLADETFESEADRRAKIRARIYELKIIIQDKDIRTEYIGELFEKMRQSRAGSKQNAGIGRKSISKNELKLKLSQQTAVLIFLIQNPEIIPHADHFLTSTEFVDEKLKMVADYLVLSGESVKRHETPQHLASSIEDESVASAIQHLIERGDKLRLGGEHDGPYPIDETAKLLLGLSTYASTADGHRLAAKEADRAASDKSPFRDVYQGIADAPKARGG